MLKKIIIFLFVGSLTANFFSLYILDKALFYRKNLNYIEQEFPNRGFHITSVSQMSHSGFDRTGVFIGGSLVKFWFLPHDLPVKLFNYGGSEEKIRTDYEKMEKDIKGSGVDYVFINSGFCEIHTAVNSGKNIDVVIKNNFILLKKIVEAAKADNIIPVVTTLTPVRPVFLFPYSGWFSRGLSANKAEENRAIEEYNRLIREYAQQKNLFLIDFHEALKGRDGLLAKKFSLTDGEHINIAGYNYLDNFLRKKVTRLKACKGQPCE